MAAKHAGEANTANARAAAISAAQSYNLVRLWDLPVPKWMSSKKMQLPCTVSYQCA